MRLLKSTPSGVLRIPKDVRREIGDEIILHPNTKSAVIYGRDEKPERVISSLRVIIMDLQQEVKDRKDEEERIANQKQPEKLEDFTPNGK